MTTNTVNITIGNAATVVLPVKANTIKSTVRQGKDLVIELTNGQTLILENYFENEPKLLANGEAGNEVVQLSIDNNGKLTTSQQLSYAEAEALLGSENMMSLAKQTSDVLLFTPEAASGISSTVLIGSAAALGAIGLVAAVAGGGGGGKGGSSAPTPKVETINNPDGSVTKKTTQPDGSYIAETTKNGQVIAKESFKKNTDGSSTTTIEKDTTGNGKYDTETTKTENPNGTTTTEVKKDKDGDGKYETPVSKDTVTPNKDGASTTESKVTHPDGSTSNTKTETKADGSSTSISTTTDAAGHTTATTQTEVTPISGGGSTTESNTSYSNGTSSVTNTKTAANGASSSTTITQDKDNNKTSETKTDVSAPDAHGSVTTTVNTQNHNTGSSSSTTTIQNPDGSSTSTTINKDKQNNQTSKTKTDVSAPDANGSVNTTSTTTNADGSKSTTKTTQNSDGSSSSTTTNQDKYGNVTDSTETNTTAPSKEDGSVTTTVETKNGAGKPTGSTVTTTTPNTEGSTTVTITKGEKGETVSSTETITKQNKDGITISTTVTKNEKDEIIGQSETVTTPNKDGSTTSVTTYKDAKNQVTGSSETTTSDTDGDGKPDTTVTTTKDKQGKIVSESTTKDMDENGKSETETVTTHNEDGSKTTITKQDTTGDGNFDSIVKEVKDTSNNTISKETETYTYNGKGDVVKVETNYDADKNNTIDRVETYSYDTTDAQGRKQTVKSTNVDNKVGDNGKAVDVVEYQSLDEHGRVVETRLDKNGDGAIDSVTTYERDSKTGDILVERQNLDNDATTGEGAGGVDVVITRTFDNSGRELTREESRNGDNTSDYIEKTDYNPNGTVNKVYKNFDVEKNGKDKWDEVITNTTFDDKERVTEYTIERTSNNVQDVKVSQTYNNAGNVDYVKYDFEMDGSINRAEKYEYNAQGKLEKKLVDGNGGDSFETSFTENYNYDNHGNLISKSVSFSDETKQDLLEKYTVDTYGRIIETHLFKDGNDKAADGKTPRKADAITYQIRNEATGYVLEKREDLDGKGSDLNGSIEIITTYKRDAAGRNQIEREFLDGDKTNNNGKADKTHYHNYNDAGYRTSQHDDNNGDGSIDKIRIFDINAGGHITQIYNYDDGDMKNENGKIDSIEERFLNPRGEYDHIDYYTTTDDGKKDQLINAYKKVEYTEKALSADPNNWERVERDSDGNSKVDQINVRTFTADKQIETDTLYNGVEDTETEFLANGEKRTPDQIRYFTYEKGNRTVELIDKGGDGSIDQVLLRQFDNYGRVVKQSSFKDVGKKPVIDADQGKVFTQDKTEVKASSVWEVLKRDVYGTAIDRKNLIDENADGIVDKIVRQEFATDEHGIALGKQQSGDLTIEPNQEYLIKQQTFNSAVDTGNPDKTEDFIRTPEGKEKWRYVYSDTNKDGSYEKVQVIGYDDEGNRLVDKTYQTDKNASQNLPKFNVGKASQEGELIDIATGKPLTPSSSSEFKDGRIVRTLHDSNHDQHIDHVYVYHYDQNDKSIYNLLDVATQSTTQRDQTTDPATGDKYSHVILKPVAQTLDMTIWKDNAELVEKFKPVGLREIRLDNTPDVNVTIKLNKETLAKLAKTGVSITNADAGDKLELSGFEEKSKQLHQDGRSMFKFQSELSNSEHTLYIDQDIEISYI